MRKSTPDSHREREAAAREVALRFFFGLFGASV